MPNYLLCLSLSVGLLTAAMPAFASQVSCGLLLSGKLQIDSRIQRIPVSSLTKQPYILSEGDERLTESEPVKVLSYMGKDFLLAVDARLVHRMGVDRFLEKHLDMEASDETAPWLKRVKQRFAGYAEEDLVVKNLSSLWGSTSALKSLEEVFFLRFYDSALEVANQNRPAEVRSPTKSSRIALISLRVPGAKSNSASIDAGVPILPQGTTTGTSLMVPLKSSSSGKKAASQALVQRIERASKAPPPNVIFQIGPVGGKPRYVTMDVEGKPSRYNPWLKRIFTRDVKQVSFTPDANTMGVVFGLETGDPKIIRLFVFKMSENEFYGQISVSAILPVGIAEIAQMQYEQNRHHLEPSFHLKLTNNKGTGIEHDIELPNFVLNNSPIGFFAFKHSLRLLLSRRPEVLEKLADLMEGENYMISYYPEWAQRTHVQSTTIGGIDYDYFSENEVRIHGGRTFIFQRGFNGKLYIAALVNGVPEGMDIEMQAEPKGYLLIEN